MQMSFEKNFSLSNSHFEFRTSCKCTVLLFVLWFRDVVGYLDCLLPESRVITGNIKPDKLTLLATPVVLTLVLLKKDKCLLVSLKTGRFLHFLLDLLSVCNVIDMDALFW